MEEPMKILSRGSEYFRGRILRHDKPGLNIRKNERRRSAVELLAESKPLYVKSESVLVQQHRDREEPESCSQLHGASCRSRQQQDCSVQDCEHTKFVDSGLGLDLIDIDMDGNECDQCNPSAEGRNDPVTPSVTSQRVSLQKRAKYNALELGESAHAGESKKLVPPKMVVDEWRDPRSDLGADQQCHASGSALRLEDKMVVVRRRGKKAIHRSRSDLTKRYSNNSDLSELSARFSRNSADLEKFFNEMGLDRSVLDPMLSSQCERFQTSSDLHLYESGSSLESTEPECSRSWESGEEECHSQTSKQHLKSTVINDPPPTSIVERNARIIKWLCSVKKATSQEEAD